MTGNLYEHSTVLEERFDEDLLDSLPSSILNIFNVLYKKIIINVS